MFWFSYVLLCLNWLSGTNKVIWIDSLSLRKQVSDRNQLICCWLGFPDKSHVLFYSFWIFQIISCKGSPQIRWYLVFNYTCKGIKVWIAKNITSNLKIFCEKQFINRHLCVKRESFFLSDHSYLKSTGVVINGGFIPAIFHWLKL